MYKALDEAYKAYALGEVPVGAVVVKNNQIIGRGHNLRETWIDSTAHAEIISMRNAAREIGDWRLNGATLYSTIEPCAMCSGAIIQFRVDFLVYGAPDTKFGAVDSVLDVVREPAFNHQVSVISGVLEDECRQIIRYFFRQLRKKK
ncbi:MAG: tRNA adenosine(34) deaminase TadA [Clostridiales bacterium]|nr:tRNA adenosine(34) deaminase TadA [Clostridiales bacterium]MCF8021525.1 tRNA adenosine(34) deaminase TadA [Clostridiales bacterium]